MRKRAFLIPFILCLLTPILLYLLGSYTLQILQEYEKSEEEKVRDWQHKHQPKQDDDVAQPDFTSSTTPTPIKEESEEEIEWITVSTRKVPVATTEVITSTTPSTTTSTLSTTPSTTSTTTEPTTTTSTTSSKTTTTTTTQITTTSTPDSPTTTRIFWTAPTRNPPIYDPYRHRYGQERVNHHQHHQHHHHGHHKETTTTPSTTTSTTTTTAPPATEPTTRIRMTTSRYYSSSYPSVSSSSSNSIYDRITVPSLPSSSSYRNPYIHRIEVTSSTYRTPEVQPTTTTHRQHHHQHHHHHHHNRTHIDIHTHHRHHIPYPQFPYPNFPNILYSTTEKSTTTTTEATEPPKTTTVEETTTTTPKRHHHGHHHQGHNRHHHSSTTRPTTTTTRESELDRWGFVESFEDLSSEEEKSSTTTTTTTSTTTTSTTTEAPVKVVEAVPERPEIPRHRQPEPTPAPTKRVEREVTLVTGFLDIGRGDWDIYRRPLDTYHKFMETLLTLENNFVVFTDESSYDFVVKTRTRLGLMDKTKVHKITLNDLPLYGYINEAKKIISDELKNETFYRTIADVDMKTHPESISAEYNIVVNSKTYFLHNVTLENPFKSEHFVWLDAGYGHANENHFPYSYRWQPALPDGKISLIKVTPYFDELSNYDLKKMYRKNVALLSGGFIAGDKHAIGQLHSIIHRKFIQLIYQNYIDDDQTLLTLAVNSYPQLFHIVLGDWFDAFRLFAADPEVQMG